ncbi:MAG: lysine--tRNA ligase [Candidatus Heimdallarchaeaceae archaeon]
MNNTDFDDEKTFKHWATIIVEQALNRFGSNQTIATGWSPSGYYHIGNFREGVTCRAFVKELTNHGISSRFLLNVDDVDPFDKIPVFFKPNYEKVLSPYMGHPISEVPDPLGCHSSFAEHFMQNAIENMESFDVTPEIVKTSTSYEKGLYNRYAILYLKKKEKVHQLTKKITGSVMKDFFLIQCPQCNNLAAPELVNYSLKNQHVEVTIWCNPKKGGCGSTSDLRLGETKWKLKWRLDWAARQDFLNVTIEPSGKDHGVAGGSIDTAIAIHKEIFGREPPLLPTYGFITFGGKKLSGSAGSGIPVSEFPKILEPEMFLYKIYRLTLRRDFDFDVSKDVPSIAAEFDKAEEIYYKETDIEHTTTLEKTIKAYELAIIEKSQKTKPLRVDYGLLVTLMQVYMMNKEKVLDKLKEQKIIPPTATKSDVDSFSRRFDLVKYWLENYADKSFKFSVVEKPNCDTIRQLPKELCQLLLTALQELPDKLSSEETTKYLYEYAKAHNLKPIQFFRGLYLTVLNQKSGPRAGTLVEVIGKERLINIFQSALECYEG